MMRRHQGGGAGLGQKGGIVHMDLKSEVARLLDQGGAGLKVPRSRTTETAPQPMRRKNPGSVRGSV